MVTNRIEHRTVYSDCVYPDWTNRDKFHVFGILDNEYVEEELERLFECNSIANKYAIQVPNMPDGFLWYKHDFKIFLLWQSNNS